MPQLSLNYDWTCGPVRIRAKATDPHEGLRGAAYIAARNLNLRVQRQDPHAAERAEATLRLLSRPAAHAKQPSVVETAAAEASRIIERLRRTA
jgi:hypothetical protein